VTSHLGQRAAHREPRRAPRGPPGRDDAVGDGRQRSDHEGRRRDPHRRDPDTGNRLEDALDRLLATAKGSGNGLVMLSTTLDGDSMPNSVCTNGCRPAIENLREKLNESARQKVRALDFIRLSDQHVTDARVTSKKLFDGKRNPALKDATKSKGADNVDLPLLTGGPVTLEALPDQMGSKNGKPGYEARKDAYATASDVALDPSAVAAWLSAHADHPLVEQLAGCEDDTAALAACATASLDGLDGLWAALEQERELTEHARRVAIYSLWVRMLPRMRPGRRVGWRSRERPGSRPGRYAASELQTVALVDRLVGHPPARDGHTRRRAVGRSDRYAAVPPAMTAAAAAMAAYSAA
jgi:hypothetical protein